MGGWSYADGEGVNERFPNFEDEEGFYLLRCFVCDPEHGRENYSLAVASGTCSRCGAGRDSLKPKEKA